MIKLEKKNIKANATIFYDCSLMSQNVDENEEYEPIIKETSKLLNQNTDSTIGSGTSKSKSSLAVPDKYSTHHSNSGTQIAHPITEKDPSTSGIINDSGENNQLKICIHSIHRILTCLLNFKELIMKDQCSGISLNSPKKSFISRPGSLRNLTKSLRITKKVRTIIN